MATSGRGSGVVGYNVQTAVDTEHHLIVAHEGDKCRQRYRASCQHRGGRESCAAVDNSKR